MSPILTITWVIEQDGSAKRSWTTEVNDSNMDDHEVEDESRNQERAKYVETDAAKANESCAKDGLVMLTFPCAIKV